MSVKSSVTVPTGAAVIPMTVRKTGSADNPARASPKFPAIKGGVGGGIVVLAAVWAFSLLCSVVSNNWVVCPVVAVGFGHVKEATVDGCGSRCHQ
jgi:hypothetical protein